jgi:single-stranded-DNA-specific exonuclease
MLTEEWPDEPIILARSGWFQGVTGIVAAKMAERYLVPAIIISIGEDGIGRGSCRSCGTFGLYDALRSCEDILNNYGGHEMAAGVTIAESKIDELRRRLASYYRISTQNAPKQSLYLDFEVEKPELLTVENVQALERLEPFGNGNPSPCLFIRDAVITAIYSIGAGKHTRIRIEKAGANMDCVFFSMPFGDLDFAEGRQVDVAFEPQINDFRGRCTVQLNLVGLRAAGSGTYYDG